MKYIVSEMQLEKLTEGWKIKNKKLHKKFKFSDYKEVMDFTNKVAKIAEKQNHHPELIVNYNSVEIIIFDHEKNEISEKCYKFIKEVNKLDF